MRTRAQPESRGVAIRWQFKGFRYSVSKKKQSQPHKRNHKNINPQKESCTLNEPSCSMPCTISHVDTFWELYFLSVPQPCRRIGWKLFSTTFTLIVQLSPGSLSLQDSIQNRSPCPLVHLWQCLRLPQETPHPANIKPKPPLTNWQPPPSPKTKLQTTGGRVFY